jgi:hypothetical protein
MLSALSSGGHEGCAGTLSDLSPCRHAPGTYHHPIPQRKRFVVHIHAGANVIGNDREDFADIKLVG